MKIFCRKIIINKPELLKESGPLLLASNHPNSFLDGMIFDTLFEAPVYVLARGDVFKKPFYARLLRSVHLLPVYRLSEGAENLGINYQTFEACKKIFNDQGVVLMFSEGKCINEWHLRPLKKGTARLALASWNEGIPLRVLPVGINYSSFRRFGKNLFINFGEIIEGKDLEVNNSLALKYQAFNTLLENQLHQLVFEISKEDKALQKRMLEKRPSLLKMITLLIPATIGWLTHWPVYLPIKRFTWKRTNHNDHFDAVIVTLLLFIYPVYLLLLCGLSYYFTQNIYVFFLLLALPFSAWAYVQLKPQLDLPGIVPQLPSRQ